MLWNHPHSPQKISKKKKQIQQEQPLPGLWLQLEEMRSPNYGTLNSSSFCRWCLIPGPSQFQPCRSSSLPWSARMVPLWPVLPGGEDGDRQKRAGAITAFEGPPPAHPLIRKGRLIQSAWLPCTPSLAPKFHPSALDEAPVLIPSAPRT